VIMPDEKNGAAGQKRAGLPPGSEMSPAPAGTDDSQQGRRASLRWVIGAGMIAATVAATFNLVYYLKVGAWQILAVVVVMALAIVCLLPAAFLARSPGSGDGVGGKGRRLPILRGTAGFDAAGAWVVIVMLLGFALTELFHQGVTLFLAPGGAVLILIVGLMVMPRRWPLLLVLVAAYGLYMVLVNWLEPSLPFARYDMGQLGQNSNVFAFFLVFCLLVAALAGIVRAYRSIVTIRLRLPASFSLVVLLTVTLLGAAVLYVASGSGRQQSVRQLDAVASIKEAEIQRWVGAVETDLRLVLDDVRVLPRMLIMLQDPRLADAQELFVWNSMSQVAGRSELLDGLLLLDPAGQVIVSTDVTEKGQDRSDAAYFQEGLQGFSVQPPVYSAADDAFVLVASRPVVDGLGNVVGVLVANLSLSPLAAMLGRQAWMGVTGEVFMVDRSGALLTDLRFADEATAPASVVGSFSVGPESQS